MTELPVRNHFENSPGVAGKQVLPFRIYITRYFDEQHS
jgi:hypothetical protein